MAVVPVRFLVPVPLVSIQNITSEPFLNCEGSSFDPDFGFLSLRRKEKLQRHRQRDLLQAWRVGFPEGLPKSSVVLVMRATIRVRFLHVRVLGLRCSGFNLSLRCS